MPNYNSEILPIAKCLKITTTSGAVYGLTDGDFDITLSGVTYRSLPGVSFSAVRYTANLAVNNFDMTLLFGSDEVNATNFRANLFYNSKCEYFYVDYTDASTTIMLLGFIGETTITDNQLKVEIRSLEDALERRLSNRTSQSCPYRFGDSRCMATVPQHTAVITAVTGTLITFDTDMPATFRAEYGIATVDLPGYENVKLDIFKSDSLDSITLYDSDPYPTTIVGQTITINAGCRKSKEACQFYNNFINFGGFPDGGDNWLRGKDYLYKNPVR